MSVRFIYIDASTGFVVSRQMLPALPGEPPEGQRIVVPADGKLPSAAARIDLRRARKSVNHVASIDDVLASWRPPEPSEIELLLQAKHAAIAAVDRDYAERIASIQGPLSSLHAEKRRQAEAGGGPLILDESDRLSILANAAEEDEKVAAIDLERRTIKARLKAASTVDEIEAIMQTSQGLTK